MPTPHADNAETPRRWQAQRAVQARGTVWRREVPPVSARMHHARLTLAKHGLVWGSAYAILQLMAHIIQFDMLLCGKLGVVLWSTWFGLGVVLSRKFHTIPSPDYDHAPDVFQRLVYTVGATLLRRKMPWRWRLYQVTHRALQHVELRWEAAHSVLSWDLVSKPARVATPGAPPRRVTEALGDVIAQTTSRDPRDPEHHVDHAPPDLLGGASGTLTLDSASLTVDAAYDPQRPSVLTLRLRQTEAPHDALVVAFDADVCDTHPWLLAVRDRAEPLQRDAFTLTSDDQRAFLDAVLPHLQASGAALPVAFSVQRVAASVPVTAHQTAP